LFSIKQIGFISIRIVFEKGQHLDFSTMNLFSEIELEEEEDEEKET